MNLRLLGPAFFLNGIASAIVAATIALSRGSLAPLAGIGISMASLLALGLSRVGDGVLDFRDRGLEPGPDVLLTIIVEVAAAGVLAWAIGDRDRLHAALAPGRRHEPRLDRPSIHA